MRYISIKYLFSILTFLVVLPGFAQNTLNVVFDSESIYVGKLKPGGEAVELAFVFTNKGSQSVVISNVETDGICSLKSYTRGSILAGGRAYINIIVKPGSSTGRFSEPVKVIFNADYNHPKTMNISGEILPRDKTIEDKYPYASGPFLFEKAILKGGKFLNTESHKASFPFYYDGRLSVSVSCVYPMQYMDVYVTPEVIHPGSSGKIHIQHFGQRMDIYGPLIDTIRMCTNIDTICHAVLAMGDMREDFSKLKPDQQRVSPRISIESTNKDFGSVSVGEEASLEFKIGNKGQRQLIIRRIVAETTEISARSDIQKIRMNKEGTISVKFKPSRSRSKVFEKILVISNDPRNPEIILYVQGVVK